MEHRRKDRTTISTTKEKSVRRTNWGGISAKEEAVPAKVKKKKSLIPSRKKEEWPEEKSVQRGKKKYPGENSYVGNRGDKKRHRSGQPTLTQLPSENRKKNSFINKGQEIKDRGEERRKIKKLQKKRGKKGELDFLAGT